MDILKHRRKINKLSQVDLASLSAVSLPSIQNIEAQRANPSLNTLSQLANTLGLKIQLVPMEVNIEEFIELGLPLAPNTTQTSKRYHRSKVRLVINILNALEAPLLFKNERMKIAFESLILALETHYPSIFHQISSLITLYRSKNIYTGPTGKHIKLRRLALVKLGEYL